MEEAGRKAVFVEAGIQDGASDVAGRSDAVSWLVKGVVSPKWSGERTDMKI